MTQKIVYNNKCRIDLMHVDEFLKEPTKYEGKRVLAIQENDYITSGVVLNHANEVVIFNYTDHKFGSLMHLLQSKSLNDVDPDLYDYEEYKQTIEEKNSAYDSVKSLGYGFKYVAVLDEYNIVIDAEDKPFPEKTLNMLTFNKDIDYYSRGPVLVVQDNCKKHEIQTMQFYPKSRIVKLHFIELQAYSIIESVQYINYYFNIDFYVDGKKLDKF